jgi:DHA2 family multidrug resistance protein
VLAAVTAIGFVAFLIWELTEKNPVVDLSLFKRRNFALGTLSFCLGYAVFFACNLLMPLWLQTQVGYTATWAGLVAAPAGVIAVLLTPSAAKLMGKVDARLIATVAFIAFGVSYLMRSDFTADASFLDFTLPLLVQGIGLATFFLAMLTILLDGIPPQKIPLASGLSNFARITAGGFAASIVTTLWDRRETLHQSRMTDGTTIFTPGLNQAVTNLHHFGLSPLAADAALNRTINSQAYLMGANDIFWASGWICLALIAMVWLCRRPAVGGGAPVAAD